MSSGVSLSRIKQIAIPVRDVKAASLFYRDILGMKHLFDAPPALSFFDCGGVRLMLSGPEAQGKDDGEKHPMIYYDVENINDVVQRIKNAGATVIQEPRVIARMGGRETWLAYVSDGQDNHVGLMSELAS